MEINPQSLASVMRAINTEFGVQLEELHALRERVIEVQGGSTISTQADVALFYLEQLSLGRTVATCLVTPAKTVLQQTPAVAAKYKNPTRQPTGYTEELPAPPPLTRPHRRKQV